MATLESSTNAMIYITKPSIKVARDKSQNEEVLRFLKSFKKLQNKNQPVRAGSFAVLRVGEPDTCHGQCRLVDLTTSSTGEGIRFRKQM